MTAPLLVAPGWESVPGLMHAFLGRPGLPPPDASAEIPKDPFCDMKKSLGLAGHRITTLRQVHGDAILDVAEPVKSAGDGDAMATDRAGVLLAILTADCVPVLLVDPRRRVCAAVHAGWRGTAAKIAGRSVAHLSVRYGCDSADLLAAIGPAIGPCCFEVGSEVVASFRDAWEDELDPFLEARGEKGMLDLRGLNRLSLLETGIPEDRIAVVGPCVACQNADFHSYRREGERAGRQVSLVGFLS